MWLTVLGWHVVWSVLVVRRTSFVPDEYWQGVEVAHRMAFGYGELTWEWTQLQPVRSAVYPALLAVPLAALRLLGLDSPDAVVAAPLVLHAVLATAGDWLALRVATQWFGADAARWALVLHGTSWCVLYCWSRTLSNAVEALLVLGALAALGEARLGLATASMALGCLVRPTSALPWALWVLVVQPRTLVSLARRAALPVAGVLLASALVDCAWFGFATWPALNFVLFNMGSSSLYGAHAWHWYYSNGLPTMLTVWLPFVAMGVWLSGPRQRWPAAVFLVAVPLAFSAVAHKEFRFLLPSLSVALLYAGAGVAHWLRAGTRGRTLRRVVVGACIAVNIAMALYFGAVHQAGPIAATDYLRAHVRPGQSVALLVPCHSLPAHARLHVPNVTLLHLRCDPGPMAANSSDVFFAPPLALERTQRQLALWPHADWLVAFEPLFDHVAQMDATWRPRLNAFHAHFPSDGRHGHRVGVWARAADANAAGA